MVLGHGLRKNSLSRSSHEEMRSGEGEDGADETVVSSEQNNILSHIISQLRPGTDLSRVTLPTFILEPRSMLERITNFMAHPELLLPMPTIDDPVQRFVAVTKFYLSGWHIKPPGVKKPLNPILGETFTGYWDYEDGTRGYYISEQTCHHPPKSSYFFMAPEHGIRIDGTLKPRSKFLGNSVGSFMEGIAVMRFLKRNEKYFVTQPNMYARGILFGKMKYELGDHALVKCPETGLEANIEFKVKGWVGGTYNAIGGFIQETATGKHLFELSGFWNEEMYIKDLSSGHKELIFDATNAKPAYPKSRPLEQQAARESQKLWRTTTQAIKKADQKTATDDKTRIEEEQRKEAADRGDTPWKPKLFKTAPPGDEEKLDWILDTTIDHEAPAQKQVEQILAIAPILPDQETPAGLSADKTLPSGQGKPLPQEGGGDDLIDFGQNDATGSAVPSQPTRTAVASQNNQSAALQEPLQPAKAAAPPPSGNPQPHRGNPVQRMDSINDEADVFVDAES